MIFSFTRNSNKSLFNITRSEATSECVDFRTKMLLNNKLQGFLELSLSYTDNVPEFSYDISGLTTIESTFSNRKITRKDLYNMVSSLNNILKESEQYLLDIDSLMLIPDKLFCDPETLKLYICYCPLHKVPFYQALNEFLCYVISNIDHQDNHLVVLAYTMQKESDNPQMPPSRILDFVLSDNDFKIFNNTSSTDIKEPMYNSCSDYESAGNTSPSGYQFTPPEQEHIQLHINPELEKSLRKPHFDFQAFRYDIIKIIIPILLALVGTAIHFYMYPLSNYALVIMYSICGFASFFYGYLLWKRVKSMPPSSIIEDILKKADESRQPAIEPSPVVYTKNYTNPNNVTPIIAEKPELNSFSTDDSIGATTLLCRKPKDNYRLIYCGEDGYSDMDIYSFPYIVGKLSSNADGIINSPIISRIHCKLFTEHNEGREKFFIEDLNSTNGTYLNHSPLTPHTPVAIAPGDTISFASLDFTFSK